MRRALPLLLLALAIAQAEPPAPDEAAPRLNPHHGPEDAARCATCHTEPAAPGAAPEHANLRQSLARPCGPCHSGPVHAGVEVHLERPASVDLPLHDGRIACFTCHDVHAERDRPHATSPLAEALRERALTREWSELADGARLPGVRAHEALLHAPLDTLCARCHGSGP